MVAPVPAHDLIVVDTPFYARPGASDPHQDAPPVLHKFARSDFVPRFIAEARDAAENGSVPPSLLKPFSEQGYDFDQDALDFLNRRFRKLYQPAHYRFYLAACELHCAVPGLPAPHRTKVKKVELVLRRVAVRREKKEAYVETDREWAWTEVPEPNMFLDSVPKTAIELAPKATGNTHTWWPIPPEQGRSDPMSRGFEGEQRFPMVRAFAPGKLGERALYFVFVPLASGEMYGPRPVPQTKEPTPNDPGFVEREAVVPPAPADAPSLAPDPLTSREKRPLVPLVAAPTDLPLSLGTMRSWRRPWQKLLSRFGDPPTNGPRPKLESPPLSREAIGGWAYVLRCVATLEPKPGCEIERWSAATPPMLIAPFYDPFGGRPTEMEVPSYEALKSLIAKATLGQPKETAPVLSASELAQRGGLGFAIKASGTRPEVSSTGPGIAGIQVDLNAQPGTQTCFQGIPLLMICAYLMLSIAKLILFPIVLILSALEFCFPPRGP
jgi:hypothetical protein